MWCSWKLLFAVVLLSLTLSRLSLAADERFSVEINVDVTDDNASLAREKALNEANRAAIVEVAKRITTAEGAARLGAMNNDQLINFIKEVSVNSEKSSNVRYIANLRVVLNEDMLRQYMEERQIPLLMQTNSRILVVPVFREFSSDKPLLWESGNLWRQAWDNAPHGNVVSFIPLTATGSNYAIIDADKALSVNGEALEKLMRVNGADDVYVLDAVYDGIDGLKIKATSYNGDQQNIKVFGSRSSGAELFNNAVREVEQRIEQKSKQQTLAEGAMENSQIVMYGFNLLSEWIQLEKTLHNLPQIKAIEMQALGTDKVQFKLLYGGSSERLIYDLRNHGYSLSSHGNYALIEKK